MIFFEYEILGKSYFLGLQYEKLRNFLGEGFYCIAKKELGIRGIRADKF